MPPTLLEKAKSHRIQIHPVRHTKAGAEIEELAIAWVRGEVTFTQACLATGKRGASLYSLLAVALRRAVLSGRLKLKA
jgi:hypothetical protein